MDMGIIYNKYSKAIPHFGRQLSEQVKKSKMLREVRDTKYVGRKGKQVPLWRACGAIPDPSRWT